MPTVNKNIYVSNLAFNNVLKFNILPEWFNLYFQFSWESTESQFVKLLNSWFNEIFKMSILSTYNLLCWFYLLINIFYIFFKMNKFIAVLHLAIPDLDNIGNNVLRSTSQNAHSIHELNIYYMFLIQ